MAEKKEEFVVSDRRRFAPEGELRTDAPTAEAEVEKPAPTATPQATSAPPAESSSPSPADQQAQSELSEEMPPPPSVQEQQEQRDAYKASGKKLDDLFTQAAPGKARIPAEMTFERLIESFYMTALLQLGALRAEGETPQVDIIGARQTIDSLSVLQEKTKGNLSDREQHVLQNILFELRMAWIEITNAIASGAAGGPGVAGPAGGIKK
ncbi:MAG TPA: DUF1844 domain-containing protein [Candidatus Angelobacter sp.]